MGERAYMSMPGGSAHFLPEIKRLNANPPRARRSTFLGLRLRSCANSPALYELTTCVRAELDVKEHKKVTPQKQNTSHSQVSTSRTQETMQLLS